MLLLLMVVTHFFSGVFWLSELLRTAALGGLPGVGVTSPGNWLLLFVEVELRLPFSRVGDLTSNADVSDSRSESI